MIALNTAQRYAAKIIEELAPMADKIQVAGSIRRRRPECRDIDIVCLPAPGKLAAIKARCKRTAPNIFDDGPSNFRFRLRNNIDVDLYFADPARRDFWAPNPCTWGTVLLCRTGSRQFNQMLAARAKSLGLHWNPYHGVCRAGRAIAAESEASIFTALNLPFIPPEKRERLP